MSNTFPQVLSSVLELMATLADDWEYDGDVTPQTRLFGDLGFESLDLVVLCTAIQERYIQLMPFSEFFTAIGQQPDHDLTVLDLVNFVCESLSAPVVEGSR
jgi:acyl carrier protein